MKNGSVITKIVKNIKKIKTEKSGPDIHILHVTDTLTVDTSTGTGQIYIPYHHLSINMLTVDKPTAMEQLYISYFTLCMQMCWELAPLGSTAYAPECC